MSTTKVIAETGWTDKYPYKSGAGDEYYFVDRKDRNDVVIMSFSMGIAWLNGISYEPAELRSHLFLGPLSPDDFEQLIRLRKVADLTLKVLDDADHGLDVYSLAPSLRSAAKALREALAHKGEQS